MSDVRTCEECGIEYRTETINRETFRHVFPEIERLEQKNAELLKLVEQMSSFLLILRYACGHSCELHIQHRCVLKVVTVLIPCECNKCKKGAEIQ